jgi:hypothetical protein
MSMQNEGSANRGATPSRIRSVSVIAFWGVLVSCGGAFARNQGRTATASASGAPPFCGNNYEYSAEVVNKVVERQLFAGLTQMLPNTNQVCTARFASLRLDEFGIRI